MENITTHEKVRQLRTKKDNPLLIRKVPVGGYHCQEVEKYIHSLNGSMEQSQKVFNEKSEEYAAELGALAKERDRLKKLQKEYERTIESLQDKLQAINEKQAVLILENGELKAVLEQMKAEISSLQLRESEIQAETMANKQDALSQANQQLVLENHKLKDDADKLRMKIEAMSDESADRERTIQELITAKRNHTLDTNMNAYQYNLYLASSLDQAKKNMEELVIIMDAIKINANELYEKSKGEIIL